MAKKIDERVVSMQFDNRNFEKNVSQSMSTLDKLKEKLSFRGASKAMDELNGSMSRFNINPLTGALDFAGQKFNALEQIAVGALRKIGEEVAVTAQQTIKSMTGIENMGAGFDKFSKKTTAVSTLIAQGFSLEEVEAQLERLNWFTDETSYNFTDMVDSIGKFTASGQGLEDSVRAMMGIANWAALSGQNAQKASSAMYQLSQAMSKGALKYDDWKSIQNASMDTKEFREIAASTAVKLGALQVHAEEGKEALYAFVTEAEDGTPKVGAFENTLNDLFTSDGLTKAAWLNTDVMMHTFDVYGKASKALKAMIDDEWEDVSTASEAMEELESQARTLADQMIKTKEATEDDAMDKALTKLSLDAVRNIDEVVEEVNEYKLQMEAATGAVVSDDEALVALGYAIDEMSLKALKAAQQARTWEDVIDSVKDAVSTGWMNSFEAIFGNQDEAVKLMTRFANDFWDIFASGGEARNDALQVWRSFLSPELYEKATDYMDSHNRHVIENYNATRKEGADAISTIKEASALGLDVVKDYDDALERMGLNIEDLKKGGAYISGRDLLFGTEEGNYGAVIQFLDTIKTLLSTIGDAWNEIFYGTTDEDEVARAKAEILINISQALKDFSKAISINEESGKKLNRTFKGLFAILDIAKILISDIVNAIGKVLFPMFGDMNGGILDATANFGDWLVRLRDFIKQNNVFGVVLDKVATGIATVVSWIKTAIDNIKSIPWVADIITKISDGFTKAKDAVKEFFERLRGGEKAGDILTNMRDKLAETSPVIKWILEAWVKLKEVFSNVFGGIGSFFSGLWNGISTFFGNIVGGFASFGEGFSYVWDGTKTLFANIKDGLAAFVSAVKEKLGEIDMKSVIGMIGFTLFTIFVIKLMGLIKAIKEAFAIFSTLGDVLKKIGKSITNFVTGVKKSMDLMVRAQAFKALAVSILILVGALTAMYFMDQNKLWSSVKALAAIMGALMVLSTVSGIFVKNIGKASLALMAIAVSIVVLVSALHLVEDVEVGSYVGVAVIVVLATIMAGVSVAIMALMNKVLQIDSGSLARTAARIKLFATVLLGIAATVLLLSIALKIISDIPVEQMWAGVGTIAALAALVGGIAAAVILLNSKVAVAKPAVEKATKNFSTKGLGGSFVGLAASLLLFAGAIKLFSVIKEETFSSGMKRIGWIIAIFAGLLAIGRIAGENANKAGGMLLKMSGALLILIGVIALINLLDAGAIIKGIVVIGLFAIFASLLTETSAIAGDNASKAGTMLLAVSGAIAILAAIIWALSFLSWEDLAKGTSVILLFGGMFAGLIAITKVAAKTKNLKGTLITLSVAIGIIGGLLIALSVIAANGGKVITAALSLGIVITILGGLVASLAATKNIGKIMGPLIVLTAAIGVIGGIIWLLGSDIGGEHSAEEAIANAGAIAILLGVIGGITVLISNLFKTMSLIKFIEVAAMMAGLTALALWISSFIKEMDGINANNAIKNAGAIAILLGTMAVIVSFLAGGALGAGMAMTAGGGYGIAAGVITAIALAASILAIGGLIKVSEGVVDLIKKLKEAEVDNALDSAHAIGDLLLAVVSAYATLAFTGVFVPGAAIGLLGIEAILNFIKKVLEDLGNLKPEVKDAIQVGIPLLKQLGNALGSFFGETIAGFMTAVSSGVFNAFVYFGAAIMLFYAQIKPFLEEMKNLDTQTIDNIKAFAGALLVLTAAELLDQLAVFMSKIGQTLVKTDEGGDITGLSTFLDKFGAIGQAAVDFSKTVSGKISVDDVDKALEVVTKLAAVGLRVADFSDLDYFASNIPKVATGIAEFSTIVAGKMNVGSMNAATKTLQDIANIDASLVARGGLGAMFAGFTDLQSFGGNLQHLGKAIADFSTNVNGKVNATHCGIALTILERLVRLDTSLVSRGGMKAVVDGFTDLQSFGTNLEELGDGLSKFSQKVNGGINQEACNKAATTLADIVGTFYQRIPGGNGIAILDIFMDYLAGNDDPSYRQFSNGMYYLAEGVVRFSRQVTTGGVNKTKVEEAVEALEKLVGVEHLQEAVTKINGTDFDSTKFAATMGGLGIGLSSFNTNIAGIDTNNLKSAVTSLGMLAVINNAVKDGGYGGFGFVEAMGKLTEAKAFSNVLAELGGGLNGFAVSLTQNGIDFGGISESVTCALNALGTLAGFEHWDFIQKIESIKANSKFTNRMETLANGIAHFGKILTEEGLDQTAIDSAVDALYSLQNLNTVLNLVADTDKMDLYVTKLNSYADAVGNIADALEKVYAKSAAMKVDNLNPLQDTINKLSMMTGQANAFSVNDPYANIENTIQNFSGPSYIADMYKNGDISFGNANDTTWAESYIKQYENIFSSGSLDYSGASDAIANGIWGSFGSGNYEEIMAQYMPNIEGVLGDSIGGLNLDDAANKLFGNLMGSFGGLDVSKFLGGDLMNGLQDTIGQTLGGLNFDSMLGGENGFVSQLLGSLTSSLGGEDSKKDLSEAGANMVTGLSDGVKSKAADLGIAGGAAVDGFINGIRLKANQINEVGKEMATSLETGLTLTLKIQSPSKVMYELGMYTVEGFNNAITDGLQTTRTSGENLADSTTEAIRNSMLQASDVFNLSVDTEPTIRPVLDLTNIEEGAEKVSEALNADQAITLDTSSRLAANIDAGTIQNSINLDDTNIVKSIDGLHGDMLDIADRLSKLEVRMDTGALVGELVAPMDSALGSRTIRRGRG